jgi:RNA 3'-phosphate cyclase
MGLRTSVTIQKYGYYPKDMGEVSVNVWSKAQLSPLGLQEFGEPASFSGVSVCTFLADRKVAERQAKAANAHLRTHGYEADIRVINDFSNPVQKGSSLTLWTQTTTDVVLGADAIGELGKPSETVGKEAAEKLLQETRAKPTVDVHLADMLVPYIALTDGHSVYFSRSITDHLETNVWLAQEILDAKINIETVGNLYKIEKSPS